MTSVKETGDQNKTPFPAGKASVKWNQLSKPRGCMYTIMGPLPPWAGSDLEWAESTAEKGTSGPVTLSFSATSFHTCSQDISTKVRDFFLLHVF